jgi:hypothetical protein
MLFIYTDKYFLGIAELDLAHWKSQISTNGSFLVCQQLIPDREFKEIYSILDEYGANQPKYKRFNT